MKLLDAVLTLTFTTFFAMQVYGFGFVVPEIELPTTQQNMRFVWLSLMWFMIVQQAARLIIEYMHER